MSRWNVYINLKCPLCRIDKESLDHLFLNAYYQEPLGSMSIAGKGIHQRVIVRMDNCSGLYQCRGQSRGKVYAVSPYKQQFTIFDRKKMRVFKNKSRSATILV